MTEAGGENEFPELDVNRTTSAWASLAGTVFVPHNQQEYRKLVALLDGLVDEVEENEASARFFDGNSWRPGGSVMN